MSLEVLGDEVWPLGDAVTVTEALLRQKPLFTSGLIVNRPEFKREYSARLFQAAMWREYAMTWHGRKTNTGVDHQWCERIGRFTYDDCLRRARVNLYLARRCKREMRRDAQ